MFFLLLRLIALPVYFSGYKATEWEPVSLTTGMKHDTKYRIRSESDLELARPLSRKCTADSCDMCCTLSFWRHYLSVVIIGVFILALYVGIVVVIMSTLGS